MNPQPAFSAVADNYDASFSETAVGKLQRNLVWAALAKIPGKPKVLELNCGTGVDALWMAQRGWQVLATDISPEMVRVTNEKIASAGLSGLATAQVCAFADIEHLKEGPFDLIFSNFGGLNCIPADELEQLFEQLKSKLNPGGQIIAVIMGSFCCWESLYFLLKRKPSEVFRRLGQKPVEARLDANTTVKTWYYPPKTIRRLCSDAKKVRAIPIGFWLPPSYLDPFFLKRQKFLGSLNYLEQKACPSWMAWGSDHFLIRIWV